MSDTVNENDSSSKKKVIVGIIITLIIIAIIGTGVFALKKGTVTNSESGIDSAGVAVKSIHFKDTSLSLMVGETITPEIIVESENVGNEDIEFKSDDPAIAEVDVQGSVTGLASGSTTVTATFKSDNTVSTSINVTVLDRDTVTDTNVSEKPIEKTSDTDKDSDTNSKDTAASATSRYDSNKKTVSSNTSKTEESSSSTRVSQPVNSTSTRQSNNDTYQTTNGGNTTENTQNRTEEQTNSAAQPTQNTSEFIDPGSVGKSIPISYVQTEEKKVSISFDASWGNDKTQKILDTLEQYDIKTTFFLVGIWVRAYPDDVKKIAQAGHDIGNHSNTHPDLTTLDMAGIKNEMETCSRDIEALTGKRPTLFRNPFGAYDNRVIGTALGMGMDCIQWDVDTLDWTNNSGTEICARIRNNIKNGSIILMHNAGGSTADSLPMIIQTIHDLGYEIVPISELISNGDYTTDYSGKLIPKNPPVIDSSNNSESSEYSEQPEYSEDSEEPKDTDSENDSSDRTESSIETDVGDENVSSDSDIDTDSQKDDG